MRERVVERLDDPRIMAGQGTAALELLEETGPLDWLLAPVGGGGLLSGSSIAASVKLCRLNMRQICRLLMTGSPSILTISL